MNILGIVLAAGQGKRMKSKLYKVLHPVCGKPMVGHVLEVLEALKVDRKVVVVGHGADAVRTYLGDRAEYVLQEKQLGTGHAVLQAKELLGNEEGTTLIVCGDTPLIKEESLRRMIEIHVKQQAAATILTAEFTEPKGYGRITRDERGLITGIVEQKECTEEQDRIREINVGVYCVDNAKLFHALSQVTNNNIQQEYYLTDVITILQSQGETLAGYLTEDVAEAVGVNDRLLLADAERDMRARILRRHMINGVTITDPGQTYIEADVVIGADTILLPGCHLKAGTVIGEDCQIGPNTEITASRVGNGVSIKQSVVTEAVVGDETTIGPFAYLRPGTELGKKVKIGDFVEIKNARLDDECKVSHLSYIGDAQIGRNVNFGCGAITVNYDGYNKQITEVGDEAFIGSNANLIAPVKIGRGAYVVAGSTITKNVPDNDMAIAREVQINKPGYAEILRGRFQEKKRGK